ncbi:DUF397 domain-containing protein [Nocardiopsis halophila]|uniref:DUF397 domain-containing protein n=1 Tax=Nocardiopsis halophila TaxID=141692 RepID=UPI0003462225|nr:DUF397 domain-containing protein [Nocardiopsis halophila]
MTENPFAHSEFFKAGGSGDKGCVEAAITHRLPDRVGLRDSKNPHGTVLVLPPREWAAFVHHTGRDL